MSGLQENSSSSTLLVRRLLSVVVVFVLPVFAKYYLNADIGLILLVLIIIAVAWPEFLSRVRGEGYRWLRHVTTAALFVLALSILVGILITPLSAYVYWFDTFKRGSPEGGVGTIFVLLMTLFSVIIAPQAEKWGVFWPLIMLSIVVFYLLAIIVQRDYYLLIVLPLLVAASVYYVVRRVQSGAKLLNSIFAVALVVVTLIGASLFPDFADGSGNEFVNKTIFPALRKAVVKVFPRFPLLYAVPGYGMSFDESKLGSRPHLIDTPLFEVEGPSGQTLYLRTRVFDSYNGSSWSMSGYFQKTQPVRASLVDFLSSDGEVPDEALTLSMAGRSFFYLPHTLNTKKIYLESSQPLLKGGTMATGFELSGPFRDGEKIHLEQYFPGELEPEILKTDARESYLQIPEDLPEALREIARGLSRDTVSKIEILARIEAFLAYNYTYSIDVDEYAYDRTDTRAADFAYSFLFERSTGYCVHFATSFILLARLSGVPARYATGFLARIPPGETTATVTGLSAHAWPEVWLEGSGWINWEATPAANAANYTITGNEWLFNLGIDLDPATTRQLEGLIGGSIVEADGSRHREGRKTVPVKLSLVVLGSIAGAALLVVFSVRFAYPSIRYIADEEGRLYFGMRRLSRRLERKGVPRPVKTGWVLWAENLKKRIGTIDTQIDTQGEGSDEPGDPLIDTMIGTLMGLAYGGQAWSPEASSRFAAFRKYVLRSIRRRKKRREYSVS